jgi:hypothetical protein
MRSLVEFLAKSAVFEDTDHCYINLSCMVVTYRDVVRSFKLKLVVLRSSSDQGYETSVRVHCVFYLLVLLYPD